MTARVHPTAIVEADVSLGDRTAVWDNAHLRGPASVGSDCIIGEKTYVAYGVSIGDLVKINAFVYVCTGVTIERGVMIAAGTIFTNDRYPRAATSDLTGLRSSDPDEHTLATLVREGATIGAGAVIGPGIEIGRFAMVGMAAVVTRSVPDFALVIGNPATVVGFVCRCGEPLLRHHDGKVSEPSAVTCSLCGLRFEVEDGLVREPKI